METGKPSIAILMAVYEPRLDWLREQLCSLNAQTYPKLRLYIRDDASPTVPIEDIRRLAAECITAFPYAIVRSDENEGSNRVFERLTREAEGELFAYCDQDDVWRPDKLTMLEAALENPAVTMAYGDMAVIDGAGRPIASSLTELRPRLEYLQGAGLAERYFFRNCTAGCSMLIRADLARRAVPFPKDTVCDQWLALLAATEGEIRFLNEPVADYRQHADNQTGILTGVGNKDEYYARRVLPLRERLEMYGKHATVGGAISAFAEGRLQRNLWKIWKHRRLSPYEAKTELALGLLPDKLFQILLERIR